MANEFIARNGIIAKSNTVVSGSLTVTGGITGSLSGSISNATSASYALTASYAMNGGGSSIITAGSGVGSTVRINNNNRADDNYSTVIGGGTNSIYTSNGSTALNTYSTIGGGNGNHIGGYAKNTGAFSGSNATIAGGIFNNITNTTVYYGNYNTSNNSIYISGINVTSSFVFDQTIILYNVNTNQIYNRSTTADAIYSGGGTVIYISPIGGGGEVYFRLNPGNSIDPDTIPANTNQCNSTIGGGNGNTISGQYNYGSTIGGGSGNTMMSFNSSFSTIGGGSYNVICGQYSVGTTIGGGSYNTISGYNSGYSTIGGGYYNTLCNPSSMATIGGGYYNTISGYCGVIGGGFANCMYSNAASSTIGGGFFNKSCNENSTIGGGRSNRAYGRNDVIDGGFFNNTFSDGGWFLANGIGGGMGNIAYGYSNVIGGGVNNIIGDITCQLIDSSDGAYIYIGGDFTSWVNSCIYYYNTTSKRIYKASTTSAGYSGGLTCFNNWDSGYSGDIVGAHGQWLYNLSIRSNPQHYATIGGGKNNTIKATGILGRHSTISGGYCNLITGLTSTIAGGANNTISGNYSFIGGGQGNTVSGNGSAAIGSGLTNSYNYTLMTNCLNGQNLQGGASAISVDANGTIIRGTSDCRLKTDINNLDYDLNIVQALRPVSFYWCDDQKSRLGCERQIGFTAQEVQQIMPEIVGQDLDGVLSLDTVKIVPVLTKAIQELKSCNDALQNQVNSLTSILTRNNIS